MKWKFWKEGIMSVKGGFIAVLLITVCSYFVFSNDDNVNQKRQKNDFQKTVEIKKIKGKYQLYRNGEPYFVKGAGAYSNFQKIKECGGNSIRIWSTNNPAYNTQQILDEAHSLGLTVTIGLFLGPERLGFDYNDEKAVQWQFEQVKKEVIKYKDHPALLMWGIGNEVGLFAVNEKVWNAVNDIAKMIHEIDPNHPTTTMLAGVPEKQVKLIKRRCPHIDLISINCFKELPFVADKLKAAGWRGPYLFAEWGSTGYWETDKTDWDAAIEETSHEKAEICIERYKVAVEEQSKQCLGSYVFYWGFKQERTHTYFSLFLDSGAETEVLDAVQYLWTGSWPANRAPIIDSVRLENRSGIDNIRLEASSVYNANVFASDPENENIIIRWAILVESNDLKTGGDNEIHPEILAGLIENNDGAEIKFSAPSQEGAYRLFVYIYDGKNNVATGNIPFYVDK